MENFEEIKAKARQKVEAEVTEPDSPEGQVGMMLLSWLDYADNAAELILAEGKTVKGAFEAIRKYASKHKTGNCAYVEPVKAMELVLEYFGHSDPKGVIEGGLMYKCMTDAAARFKPYGQQPPAPPKPQPVAEVPKKNTLSLDSLSLEDLGL